MREVQFQRHYTKHADGSVLVSFGDTKVICSAMVEESVPPYREKSGLGWLTSEYQMLPSSTDFRKKRKTDGRGTEISRLIGRSLRSCVDFKKLGPRTIWIDCDVIQADGGTRTASITGGFVALHDAISKMVSDGRLEENPLTSFIAAISVGYVGGQLVVDLDYAHDSKADVDMNLVGNDRSEFIEIQGTAEGVPFSREKTNEMLDQGQSAISKLIQFQKEALGV